MTVLEGSETIGVGCRSEELTLPGFVHESRLPLAEHGLELVHPGAPLAHPLDDGSAVLLERSVDATAGGLGRDADAYRRPLKPLVCRAPELMREILGPLRPPRHPLAMARFAP